MPLSLRIHLTQCPHVEHTLNSLFVHILSCTYLPLPLPLLPLPLQGTRHRESDRMARYGSSDEEDDEEATAQVVRCNDIHEML